jgi:hypothetical protein
MGVILALYLNNRVQNSTDNYLNRMVSILRMPIFKGYTHLYKDSKLLQFLHSMRIYHDENPYEFNALSKLTNNFIALSDAIQNGQDPEGYNANYDILKGHKIQILNIFQSLIYVTPHVENRLTFYQNGMVELESLLNYHIDRVHSYVTAKNNQVITIHSKFPRRDEIQGPVKDITLSVSNRYNYFGI